MTSGNFCYLWGKSLIWLNCIDSHCIHYLMPALELTVFKVVFGFSECLADFNSIHADAVDFE